MDNTKLLADALEDESAAFVSIAEAAMMGARNSVLEEVHRAAEEVVAAQMEVGAEANGAPPSHAMVAGVLPLARAEIAAAEGALNAVQVAVCLMPPVARKLLSSDLLLQVQAAAATGAAAGVRGSAFKAPLPANPPTLDKNFVATAAGSGAYGACYHALRAIPRNSTVNQWAARLPPVLGASLALAAGVYPRLTSSSDMVVSGLYGGLILLIFMLMVGIVAAPFRSMSPETVSRHVTFASFTTLIVLLTVVLCTLLSGTWVIVSVGFLGGLAVVCLIYLWRLSNRYYRTS